MGWIERYISAAVTFCFVKLWNNLENLIVEKVNYNLNRAIMSCWKKFFENSSSLALEN